MHKFLFQIKSELFSSCENEATKNKKKQQKKKTLYINLSNLGWIRGPEKKRKIRSTSTVSLNYVYSDNSSHNFSISNHI